MTDPNQTERFDLIVIGAGINGAGVARDAALRGLKVCLLDKGDIGGGSSSASTRLIHGGLRYLEHWEFGLVRESLREREILLRIAPHLVKPLPILIPIYKGAKRGPLQVRAGMLLYDMFSFNKKLPRHRILSRDETLKLAPGLNPNGLLSAAVYYDAQVEFAERLVLENVLDATNNGAVLMTYARVTSLTTENNKATGVEFVANGQSRRVAGDFMINAAGPWVDELLKRTGTVERLIGATKGSHIVVAPFQSAPSTTIYAEAHTNGRPFFIIPWNGNYLIGTTDTHFNGDLDHIRSEESEIDYLIAETNHVLPQARLTKNDVLYSYAGLRPLPFTDLSDEQKITRRHFIRGHRQLSNVVSLVGGKLTTYRSLAAECVDLIFSKLGKTSPPCKTAQTALPGGEDFNSFANEFGRSSSFSRQIDERLPRIYGTRAASVVETCRRSPELSRPLGSSSVLAGEIVFGFEQEHAQTLTDCLLRRTMAGFNADLFIGPDEDAATICKTFLGWTDERADTEVESYRDHVAKMHTQV
ncbi:MAG TPA: glycerol-3-phosphate dehydrogenase [Pyrinomonadaceae bacterium]